MKILLIFSMAIAASQAFFLPNDFFADMAQRMRDFHSSLRPRPPSSLPPSLLPEIDNVMNQKMKEMFDSLTPEEQAALKNHLFGVRFPRPLPASHFGGHQKPSQEQIEEMREKWNSMTPEEKKEKIEQHQFRNYGNGENFKFDVEKLEALREKYDAMTVEEREAFRNEHKNHAEGDRIEKSPRSFQAIKPLDEIINPPMVKSPRSFQAIKPLPEFINPPMVRSPRSFQAIKPLPEFIAFEPASYQSDRRPSNPGGNQRPNLPDNEGMRRPMPEGPGGNQRPNFPGGNDGSKRPMPERPGGNERQNIPGSQQGPSRPGSRA